MVGDGGTDESVEESENFLKELSTVINSNPVKRDLFQEWQEYKSISEQTVDEETDSDEETITIITKTPPGGPRKWNYDDPNVRFFHRYQDGSEEELRKGTPNYNNVWRRITGREDPMTQKMIDLVQEPRQPSKEFEVPDPPSPQDVIVPGQDQGPYIPPDEPRSYMSDTPIAEYGAPGSGIGNDTARNPAEEFAKAQERKANKQNIQGQIASLVAQLQAARAQLADLNQQFPQGANPVEKTMVLQQMNAQKIQIKKQIEDLTSQIAALRQQAI
jgi:hypothetical protein